MISLVVPVYNMERYLDRCMNALLTQRGDYEVIMVDDGSIDDSAKMCNQYALKYPEVVHVIHKRNGGLSSARNAGMEVARGEFVVFPDPDDWVEAGYVSTFLELQKKYDADLVGVGYFIDYENERQSVNEGQKLKVMGAREAQRSLFYTPSMGGFAWNKLFRMDIIRKHKLRFLDDVGTTEDLDFVFRYLRYCDKIVFSPEAQTYHYYQRPGAATHSGFSPKKMESIHTYEKIIQISRNPDVVCAAHEEICNSAINLICSYLESHDEDKRVYQKIRSYIKREFLHYLKSRRYGYGRKIQAFLALCVPKIYVIIKNIISRKV